jgi:hypothetical protein
MGDVVRLRGGTVRALARCLVEQEGVGAALKLAQHMRETVERSGDRGAVFFWSILVEEVEARIDLDA